MDSYIVAGMKRSGQHAIINWICEQHGNITHKNDCKLSTDGKKVVSSFGETVYGPGECLLLNLENYNAEAFRVLDAGKLEDLAQYSERTYKVLVVRDMRNWVASCLARKSYAGKERDPYTQLNKSYIDGQGIAHPPALVTYRGHIDALVGDSGHVLVIDYDKWVQDKDYRKVIAKILCLNFTDGGLNTISEFGNGSSFDNMAYNGRAQEMDVLNRYRYYNSDSEYSALMKEHAETLFLSDSYFGAPYKRKKLLIGRTFFGLGDWIMMYSAIKMLNIQYPEVQVDLDMAQISD